MEHTFVTFLYWQENYFVKVDIDKLKIHVIIFRLTAKNN